MKTKNEFPGTQSPQNQPIKSHPGNRVSKVYLWMAAWVFAMGLLILPHTGEAQTSVAIDCAKCHQLSVGKHHAMPQYLSGNCAYCHTGITVTNDCTACHSKVAGLTNKHHQTPEALKGNCAACHTGLCDLKTCLSCHISGSTRDQHHSQVQLLNRKCTDCHTQMLTPVDSNTNCKGCHGWVAQINPHHMSSWAVNGDCMYCHRMAWNPILSAITAETRSCMDCHASTSTTTLVSRHHQTNYAISGQCTYCHAGASATLINCAGCHTDPNKHHGLVTTRSLPCAHCHTTIRLITTSCRGCHTRPIPDLHHGTPLQNVGGDCGYCHQGVATPTSCSNCHKASPHHTTTYATSGNCTHCHARPTWAMDAPKQAACRQCHGAYKHNNGGPIQDFGACFACHSPVPYHAKPKTPPTYWDPAPGKGTFNLFYNQFRRPEEFYEDTPLENFGENVLKRDQGRQWRTPAIAFNWATIDHKGMKYNVPSFDGTLATPAPSSVPTLGISAPKDGATVSGIITIAATASDSDRISRVYAWIGGFEPIPMSGPRDAVTGTWTASWDTRKVNDGYRIIYIFAQDRLGNSATKEVSVNVANGNGGGATSSDLNVCFTCHGDLRTKVTCANTKWRDHLTKNLVTKTVYELAEMTYLQKLCSGTTAPADLSVCTTCHGNLSAKVSCSSGKWRDHLTKNRVTKTVYELAETTYLGLLCSSGTSLSNLSVCTSCHGDYKARVSCTSTKWREHLSRNHVSRSTYELAEKTYLGALCSIGGTTTFNTAACSKCHSLDKARRVSCYDGDWRKHLTERWVDKATYEAAEQYYLGYVCAFRSSSTYTASAVDLTVCTSCHVNQAAKVNCDNAKWREHLSKNRVTTAVYDAAELAYLGRHCGGGYSYSSIINSDATGVNTGGTDPLGGSVASVADLGKCVTCHVDYKAKVNCRNKIWLEHLRKNYVGEMTFKAAEITYLGAECTAAITNLPVKNKAKKTFR